MAGGMTGNICLLIGLVFIIIILNDNNASSAFLLKRNEERSIVATEAQEAGQSETEAELNTLFNSEDMYKTYMFMKNRGSIKMETEKLTATLFTQQAVGKSVYDVLNESLHAEKSTKKQKTSLQATLSEGLSAACETNVMETLIAVVAQQTWALRIVDAAGKIGSGILDGNIHWYGSYDECVDTVATSTTIRNGTNKMFGTKYYLANVGQGMTAINLGVCVPETCNTSDVNLLVTTVLSRLSLGNMTVNSVEKKTTFPLDGPAIAMICVLTILVVLLIIATAYDILIYQPILEREQQEQEAQDPGGNSGISTPTRESSGVLKADEYTPLLAAKAGKPMKSTKDINIVEKIFTKISLYTNGQKLLYTGVTSNATLSSIHGVRFISMTWVILGHTYFFNFANIPLVEKMAKCFSLYSNSLKIINTSHSSGVLSCLHGIRLISMFWVILGHTFFFLLKGSVENILQFEKLLKRFSFQAIINATVSVDTFFLLSGILVSYLVLREIKEQGGFKQINWALFYFHRFWRLTPPYMLVLGAYTALYRYFGNGPIWPGDVPEPHCRDHWWTNILYINNIVHPGTGCMMWTWYLASDMQFHILSPLFLIPLSLHFGAGLAVIMVVMLISFIVTGVISVQNGYPPSSPAILYFLDKIGSFFKNLYIIPWTRIGPYLVGILIGYALYRTDRKVRLSKWVVALGWTMAAACNLAILYGLYDQANGAPIDASVSAFYNTVHRTAWACGVGWVIFACVTGYGGPVNKLLSWPALIPLSRLTYMAYLIHPIIMEWFYQSRRNPVYIDDPAVIYFFLGHLCMSYGVGFVLSLAFEAPMMGLEKLVFKRK